ncbi:MAG: anhydro-N-acetylmuramic acid kinase [Alphaproteobacteria bacterium]|nr:anhydro-N-acetylmuramic acid kinase [Alphaproteobacteria bacterium]
MKVAARTAMGLYSDASALTAEAAVVATDGIDILSEPVAIVRPYPDELRRALTHVRSEDLTQAAALQALSDRLTAHHVALALELREKVKKQHPVIDIVGYSGHTLWHSSAQKRRVSIGNADDIAQTLGAPVADRFAQADMLAGGVGGPLLPVFWEAMTKSFARPLVFLNLGGITTQTYIGAAGELQSFDIGVGCLLIDKFVQKRTQAETDYDGLLGAAGTADERVLRALMQTPYLTQPPPKILDRNDFDGLLRHLDGMSVADGVATLVAFIARSIAEARRFLPAQATLMLAGGGGISNPALMRALRSAVAADIQTLVENPLPDVGINAMGYAFLAARAAAGLPITLPSTTGAAEPVSGATIHHPLKSA